MVELNRRTFLSGSVAAGAAALFGTEAAHAAGAVKLPAKWDETADVVIVGSGFAGLAAAIEAKKAGASVVVLEKMATVGGNSIINGGILTATGCPQQKKHGIKDSPELLAHDMLVAGLYLNNPEKVKLVADNALSNYEWTVNELGVEYNPDAIGQEGGHSVPRYVFTKNGSGSGIVSKEVEKLEKLGVKVRTRTYVKHVLRDDTGRVLGLEVLEGYRFPKTGTGKTKFIRAKKAVILCYGGFSRDVEYRTMQDPKLTAALDSTNQTGATSELWRETSRIGCAQVQNDWIQCTPWNNPKEKGMGIGWTFAQSGAAEYGLWVATDGKRFVNELANRKVRADAIVAIGHPCLIYTSAVNAKANIINSAFHRAVHRFCVVSVVALWALWMQQFVLVFVIGFLEKLVSTDTGFVKFFVIFNRGCRNIDVDTANGTVFVLNGIDRIDAFQNVLDGVVARMFSCFE